MKTSVFKDHLFVLVFTGSENNNNNNNNNNKIKKNIKMFYIKIAKYTHGRL